MTPQQEFALTGGGVTELHRHPHTVTIDQLRRMYELEQVVFITTNYDSKPTDDIIFVDASSPVTVTMPFASGGRHAIISLIGSAASVSVVPQSGETINGAASYSITTQYKPLRLKAIKGVGYLEI